jgi:ribonuclease E
MPLFRRKTARSDRDGAATDDRKARAAKRGVTIRRYEEAPPPPPQAEPRQKSSSKSRSRQNASGDTKQRSRKEGRSGSSGNRSAKKSDQRSRNGNRNRSRRDERRRQPQLEIVQPPETARKQMLVRSMPHQTQIVVLEGPVLVEHYVARSDQKSLIGNVYVGKVRNVLPGMEAAFVDFGEGKNGVLYAGDVNYDEADVEAKRPRIEMVLKPGDSVLVQVVKDAMGKKGARLTNQISLAGRYLVLAPDADVRGISRRLPDEERRRLREIIAEIRPKGMGVIVRTAAEGASREDLASDIERLQKIWQDIDAKRETSAPALIHSEPPLVLRVIREHFTKEFKRLLIDRKDTYDSVFEYLEGTEADLTEKVNFYEDDLPLFERFHVEDQLRKALDRKVWLPSGGHVVIDRTEALTVIDVNTGRFVGHSNLEQTVLQNNLEAAEEIARQLRLRDIGGIIVIDFIDMEVSKNRDAVLLRLREHLAKDKTRTQVFEVSNLGLVEMTRKNVSAGLLESFSEVCPHCSGRGVLLHEDAATQGIPVG